MNWLRSLFNRPRTPLPVAPGMVPPDFQPQGHFFRSAAFPEIPVVDNGGHTWLEAGRDSATGDWTVWLKTARRQTNDLLNHGQATDILHTRPLLDKIGFTAASEQMVTFERAHFSQDIPPLPGETAEELGTRHYRRFAWNENLVFSRAGQLAFFKNEEVTASGFFDLQEIADAKAHLAAVRANALKGRRRLIYI